ncbi:MAG: hypothetical protein ABTQ28_04325 [Thauera sp.]
MSDEFKIARETLANARSDVAEAESALAHVREKRVALEAAWRRASARDVASAKKALEQARRTEEAAVAHLKETKGARDTHLGAFVPLADPRDAISQLDAQTPILLLPVRLEARFKRVGNADELWVRIYPDDCAIDNFEPDLTQTEFDSAKHYWAQVWTAMGRKEETEAAWRNLVASHGAGRATWILQQVASPGSPPTAGFDLVLVILSDMAPGPDRDLLETYWTAVWRARDDKTALDAARAALEALAQADVDELIAGTQPDNLTSAAPPGVSRATARVAVAWLDVPSPDNLKTRSTSAPSRVNVLPDRFVVMGYQKGEVVFEALTSATASPLVVSVDFADPQLAHTVDGDLEMPPDLAWMSDFASAIKAGMGVKIPLDPARVDPTAPIDRLIALGVRLSEDAAGGQRLVEELITHQRFSRPGFAFVPQGAPTNNSENEDSAFARGEDATAPPPAAATNANADWWSRRDGDWFAGALGISADVLEGVHGATRTDFSDARAMNRLLWPTTLGYALDTMMAPVMSHSVVESVRWFYTHFVTGRGFLPSLRIGNQPYGVLPVSAISQWKWLGEGQQNIGGIGALPDDASGFLVDLARVLDQMRKVWRQRAERGPSLAAPGPDLQQTLVDVLSLNPASVEFFARYAESLEHLFNLARLNGAETDLVNFASDLGEPAFLLLRSLGYRGDELPDALNRYFQEKSTRLNGPLVDDRPLSEKAPIRAYTADGKNYLAWLSDKARNDFESLRQENGFSGNAAPNALLYGLARNALLLGYWDQALVTLKNVANFRSTKEWRREATTVHVATAEYSESRYAPLYHNEAQATGGAPTVAIAIQNGLASRKVNGGIAEQVDALDQLKDASTARLERCLVEHLDTASHRLDAWLLGLVNYQLSALRYRDDGNGVVERKGLYLGAVGWLEGLQRKPPLTQFVPEAPLAEVFGTAPVSRDPTNGGYLLAPSLTHAKSAAILRAGHLSAKSPQARGPLAVNLSSARVRIARDLIEGLRNGQPLGALLGYRLQRALSDRGLHDYLHALRLQFPLVANQLAATKVEGVPIESIEADNVVDGEKLLKALRDADAAAFARTLIQSPSAADVQTVVAEIRALFDATDALADLALAEGVHQAVRGNYDRVGSTLEAWSKGTFPPEPDIIQTPRSGVSLTHRVGLHFDTGVPFDHREWAAAATPRAMAQPMLNKWLASMFPAADQIRCVVDWDGAAQPQNVTAATLGLEPIDLLYIGALDGEAGLRELDDRILRRVVQQFSPPAGAEIRIDHLKRPAQGVSFFELGALVRHLRGLALASRPLTGSDLSPAGTNTSDSVPSIDRQRLTRARTNLGLLKQALAAFAAAPPVNTKSLIGAISDLFAEAASFGVQQVGWGYLHLEQRTAYRDAFAALQAVIDRWTQRRAEFVLRWQAYTAITSPAEQLTTLARLDIVVTAKPLSPRPTNVGDYETEVQNRRAAFEAKYDALKALAAAPPAGLDELLDAIESLLVTGPNPMARFDNQVFDLAVLRAASQRLRDGVLARIPPLITTIDKRDAQVGAALTKANAAVTPAAEVAALQEAGTALLGADLKLIPEVAFGPQQSADMADAITGSGTLLDYARTTSSFPIEDWLLGAARVRDKMFALEQSALFAQAISQYDLSLKPLQLPAIAGESWYATKFDPARPPGGERLAYTAHFVGGPQSARTCGLLVDEWTEVIPAKDESIGLAFHYDRPNSEPPQAWLLVTAPRIGGAWQWGDVLGALDETFDLLRLRAVQPGELESLPYARFLPATTSAAALNEVSISLNYARVNNYVAHIKGNVNG